MAYDPSKIEPKWQQYWEEQKTFKAEIEKNKDKFYVLDMFPYPSAHGLHVGHLEGYTATDIVARYKRMKGFNVLHTMGWDAFGLPAEQYAIKTGTHPKKTTEENVNNFRKQIKRLGFSYDWDREINTTDPKYYKWTQWIFTKLYEQGLAYQDEAPVNWCPALKTVLANEEVIDGKSERGGHPVERKLMRQWKLKITAYAEKLLEGLEELDWPEAIKEMQRNWIGKSKGAVVNFKVSGFDDSFEVFTTRPDTLFGATYCVLAPEHKLVEKITSDDRKEELKSYVKECSSKSDLARTDLNKEKTGVFTGAFAVNPVNGKKVPIWVADYVLITYGSGAIMAVPAHDQRDFEFAKKFNLEIQEVISGGDISKEAYSGSGELINSDFLNGLGVEEAKNKMISYLEENSFGEGRINFKMRDWLFSRQRYWGEPFPLVMKSDGRLETLSVDELPLTLPEVENYQPSGTGESPLATIDEWINITDSNGESTKRDSNTMPQWAGSCWYYLRFIDPLNENEPWSKEAEQYWMPVDLYIGGAEHAVLHLLYARFWHKLLYDIGYLTKPEPFQKLVNQGMILGENNQKMSKSLGNVISPDDVVDKYGADAIRMYEMFMGPLEKSKPWNMAGVEGIKRFLNKVWNFVFDENDQPNISIVESAPSKAELSKLHETIKKVTGDLDDLKFNTGISQLMVFINEVSKQSSVSKELVESFVKLLSPYAPHMAEEIWSCLGNDNTLAYESWPEYDERLIVKNEIEVPVQINGKIRDKLLIARGLKQDQVFEKAKKSEKVLNNLQGKEVIKVIYIQDKILNIVVKG